MGLAFLPQVTTATGNSLLADVPTTVYTTDCAAGGSFCLLADEAMTVYAGGRLISSTSVCAEREQLRLSIAEAFDGLNTGPYEVSWEVAPGAHRARLTERHALLSFMRESTPEARWRKGEKGAYLGSPEGVYGRLTIADVGTGAYAVSVFDTVVAATEKSYVLPVGTHQLIAETSTGADTTVVQVLCTPSSQREVRIRQGTLTSYCLLSGSDPEAYTWTVLRAPDPVLVSTGRIEGSCFEIEAKRLGRTIGVYEGRHKVTGHRERLEVAIEVVTADGAEAPTLHDDYAVLAHNGQGLIDALTNDVIPGMIQSVSITKYPAGAVSVDARRRRIRYSAPEAWCGRDSLRYSVCNQGGCAEAVVRIEVACNELLVFSGFSPNGDGLNDAFVVLGIENYPENTVTVFDEFGNRVFRATGYVNDWEGTTGSGALGDGTYFYVVQAEGFRTLSGAVQLRR